MEIHARDTVLLFKINHSQPIEVKDFVTTMGALSSLFENFVKDNADSTEGKKAKLYVEKIEQGCIEIYLQEIISACALPFIENFNPILLFADYIKDKISNLISGKTETKYTVSELKDIKDLLSTTASDPKGTTEIGVINRNSPNHVFNNCTFNFMESNSAQNQAKKMIEEKEKESPVEIVHERQLMKIFQMRSNLGTNVGNKAVIDSLHKTPLSVVFETEDLKRQILSNDENPAKLAFLVDVIIQTINGKATTYKVMALHEIIPLE